MTDKNFHGVPQDNLEALALSLLPLLMEFFDSETGQHLLNKEDSTDKAI